MNIVAKKKIVFDKSDYLEFSPSCIFIFIPTPTYFVVKNAC